MTRRIFRSIVSVSVSMLLACLLLVVGSLHGYFQTQLLVELESRTLYIAHGIEVQGLSYLTTLKPENRITWIDSDGTVLYDSHRMVDALENHLLRPEIKQAFETGEGTASRFPDTLGENTTYSAWRLSAGPVVRTPAPQHCIWLLLFPRFIP